MRIVIVGAGDVGTHITENLDDTHDIAVVDTDPERVEQVESSLDATAIEGDGRSFETLENAGIHEAEVVIASTDDDAVNVMVCGAVNNVTDASTIARAKSPDLYETWQEFEGAFGIDLLLSIDRLAADSAVRTVTIPGALSVSAFADGTVEMAEFEIDAEDAIANERVGEIDDFPSLTFAGVIRESEVRIPNAETVIEPGDRLVVIGSPGSVRRFATRLAPEATLDTEDEVVIVGGGEVGYRTATLFEEHGFSPRLIEHDAKRADELTEMLSDTTVVEGDVTSFEFIAEANIDDADLLVGTLDDETNYLLTLLAANLGVSRTAAVVNEEEYVDLFEAVGVDVVIQPHAVIARETTHATREYTDEAVMLEHDSAEVLEKTVESDSVLAGESVSDVAHDLPDGFAIGAIVRRGSLTSAAGSTVIQVDDHVVAFVDTDVLDEVAAVL